MTESIFVRVQRVLSTGVETGVGAIERASGSSLMREAIRQVDRALDDICAEQAASRARRAQAARQQQTLRERLATLSEQARFAMSKGREDLAEAAVARQLDYEAQAERLKKDQAQAAAEAARLDACLAAMKVRKAEMEKELAAFQTARREAACGEYAATPAERSRTKVARAEAAFERAMAAAGGGGAGLIDPEEAAKLAEVDAMQRDDRIAARLAALRAQAAPAPAAAGRKRPAKGAGKR